MLREMLTSNGINKAEISLEAVSAPVMRSVLEYLYTGTIGALTRNLALEVIMAARFFVLSREPGGKCVGLSKRCLLSKRGNHANRGCLTPH